MTDGRNPLDQPVKMISEHMKILKILPLVEKMTTQLVFITLSTL